jgi:flagellar export protein FliJ
MKFIFSLDPVLRVRRAFEQREQSVLAKLLGHIAELRTAVTELDTQHEVHLNVVREQLGNGMAAWELQLSARTAHESQLRRRKLQQEIAALTTACAEQRSVVLKARRNVRVIEEYRRRRLEMYQQDEQRREQQRIDDLHLRRPTTRSG